MTIYVINHFFIQYNICSNLLNILHINKNKTMVILYNDIKV